MPGAFPTPSARAYKDLLAALRHGDTVLVRRVHPSVTGALAHATAAEAEASALPRVPQTDDLAERARTWQIITRDTFRVCAALLGIAAAVVISGETITVTALAMLALLPALMFAATSGRTTAKMYKLRVQARSITQAQRSISARRRWVVTADRVTSLLTRSLSNSTALYQDPERNRARLVRRQAIDVLHIEELQQALQKARRAEAIAQKQRPSLALTAFAEDGWSLPLFYARPALTAAAIAALVNVVLLVASHRGIAALVAGLTCSILVALRWMISANEVRRNALEIDRATMRLVYPELLREVDATIRTGIDHLLAVYMNGIDVVIDANEDLEPQVRRQLEGAVVQASATEERLGQIIDLRELPQTPSTDPTSN